MIANTINTHTHTFFNVVYDTPFLWSPLSVVDLIPFIKGYDRRVC